MHPTVESAWIRSFGAFLVSVIGRPERGGRRRSTRRSSRERLQILLSVVLGVGGTFLATHLLSKDPPIVRELDRRDISLSDSGPNAIREDLSKGTTGYSPLAESCLRVMRDRRLRGTRHIPLDVVNKWYKIQIGKNPNANLGLEDYRNLAACEEALLQAWQEMTGTTAGSFDEIAEPIK